MRKEMLKILCAPLRAWLLVLAGLLAVSAGITIGVLLVHSDDLPQVAALEAHRPGLITGIYDRNGERIGQFATQKRVLVGFDQIPDDLKNAMIAVEDSRFYSHPGIDLKGIARAMVNNARAGRLAQGGSTLTQQLAKLLFLSPEKSLERKAKEAILALGIEKMFSKQEILAFYCNQIYLGHNRYGVDAASRYYFGKPVWDLTLAQCALIAGLPQRPSGYSPIRHPQQAQRRRNHVLDRMVAEGFVSAQAAEAAKRERVALVAGSDGPDGPGGHAEYFVEEVRKILVSRFGEERVYQDGLQVHTTLDARVQAVAHRALEEGLRALDKRQGWRGPARNILDEGIAFEEYRDPTWSSPLAAGSLVRGVVRTATRDSARIAVGSRLAILDLQGVAWTGSQGVDRLVRPGDLIDVRFKALRANGQLARVELEQEPAVEGALVALDVATGQILAMQGGFSFARSKFNCAVQAPRQPGSAFKPVYYAAAFNNGLTPSDTFFDEPIAIEDPHTKDVYVPRNYSRQYYGLTTLRTALEKSRNPVSVQLMQKIGYDTAIDFARRLGITSHLNPYPSLALGACEVTLLEQTAAYQIFANRGVRCRPYYITSVTDRDGNLVLDNSPESSQVIREDTAFLITQTLRGVIERGTGASARDLGLPLAGKTGTTDDYTDAWFIGYSPRIVCGVWIGFDKTRKPLGDKVTGALAALPVWKEFMGQVLDPDSAGEFVRPANVDLVEVDPASGLRATDSCATVVKEAFVRGTEPVTYCSEDMHELLSLPYELQREALDLPENLQHPDRFPAGAQAVSPAGHEDV